ncbi:MAG TPA: type IX secretion system sortase PorU [Flavobacteriaceae bacterium]|nr:type IX secretion system sortase PorU [Flavobacteriaceae bacterium]
MKTQLAFLFILTVLIGRAQQKKFTIQWVDQKEISQVENSSVFVPGFDGRQFDFDYENKIIFYTTQWKAQNYISGGKLHDITFQPISKNLLKNIDLKKIPKQVEFKLSTQHGRDQLFAVLKLSPIINDQGIYKKITSFSISYQHVSGRAFHQSSTPPIGNSIFSSGEWFRFYVEETGVYKLTRSFLQSLGMNVSNINPNKLKIVGHGGEMLPLLNSENHNYDPPQTSIQIVGGNDGSFDSGDYILFYGKGITGYSEENKTNLNLYAERSYYYITADGGNGLRIFPFTQPSGNATTTIDSYDDYQFYEKDDYSLVKVGRRWFGDRFDIENQQSYEFDFENIVSGEPMTVKVLAAATAEVQTSMEATVNGASIGTMTFEKITDTQYAFGNTLAENVPATSETVTVDLTYHNGGSPSSVGYLDYISVAAKRNLIAGQKQFDFRLNAAATLSGIAEYRLQNTANISQIWDVTDPANITTISNSGNNSISFKAVLGEAREYVAISPSDYYFPQTDGNTQVQNQNLKGSIFENAQGEFEDIDYLIITNSTLSQQANRLAEYRRQKDGLNVKVVLLETIYQEFSSGKQDIVAIRNFVKYVYDNASSENRKVKYLCLFGDGSVDYKNRLQGNNNMVPTYESLESFRIGESSFPSDDFYGMMDSNEGKMTNDKADIAVGRILADNLQLAETMVDKIIDYEKKESYGSWRNNFVLIADDADESGSGGFGLQVNLNNLGDEISEDVPFINVYKILSDAYQQVSSSGGERYPEVNEDISEAIEVGASVINYLGHGGEDALAQERIITNTDIESWTNVNKYNVFVIITCEFTKFDNPLHPTGGENILWQKNAGAVASIATVRSVSVGGGTSFNLALPDFLFNNDDSVAEALRKAKNAMGGTSKRVVFFFGDPAMKLALPQPKISLTAINDIPVTQSMDTLKALDHVKIAGKVTTPSGALLSNYNGILSTTIFDKRIDRQTLNNNGQGVFEFTTLGEIIFRGKASVSNGLFEFDFVVPKDISIPVGTGRISFYSEKNQELEDQTGYNNAILVGGINENAPEDNLGPEIKLFMNDENFVSGGITNESPFLLVKLADENGINTASGIGHDLVAILDGDETNPYVVNDYYETEVDDYTQGSVFYKLRDLDPGIHTLTFKAWDVYNNSSTAEIQFVVASDDDLKITHVLNYPNPFHNYTEFWFNHNRPYEPLQVQVQVFTVTGKVVWTKNQLITTNGFLSREITWNGKDDFGDSIGKGVYIYKLTVKSTLTNDKVEKFEKLVIL